MISHLRRPGSPVVTDYIGEVAAAVDAHSIQWWDGDHGVDAMLVLPCHIEHFRPRWAVLAWNHRFGWGGRARQTRGTVVLLERLGVGPASTPDRCADPGSVRRRRDHDYPRALRLDPTAPSHRAMATTVHRTRQHSPLLPPRSRSTESTRTLHPWTAEPAIPLTDRDMGWARARRHRGHDRTSSARLPGADRSRPRCPTATRRRPTKTLQ
jgi:hypothetical protein